MSHVTSYFYHLKFSPGLFLFWPRWCSCTTQPSTVSCTNRASRGQNFRQGTSLRAIYQTVTNCDRGNSPASHLTNTSTSDIACLFPLWRVRRVLAWHVGGAMTVLEETGPVMTSGLGGDRYITPEYLAPLPQVTPGTVCLSSLEPSLSVCQSVSLFKQMSGLNHCCRIHRTLDSVFHLTSLFWTRTFGDILQEFSTL